MESLGTVLLFSVGYAMIVLIVMLGFACYYFMGVFGLFVAAPISTVVIIYTESLKENIREKYEIRVDY